MPDSIDSSIDRPAPRKKVAAPSGETYDMHLCTMGSCACCGCGTSFQKNVHYLVACDDCGGLFCEKCVADGTFDGHECEDDEEEN